MYKVQLKKTLTITIGEKVITRDLNDFTRVRKIDDYDDCCDLIYHLKTNHLKDNEDKILYDIASIIENEIDNHGIRWFNTFMAVEKENYAIKLREDKGDEVETNVFDGIDEAINFNEDINEEMSDLGIKMAIQEIVGKELEKRKLL